MYALLILCAFFGKFIGEKRRREKERLYKVFCSLLLLLLLLLLFIYYIYLSIRVKKKEDDTTNKPLRQERKIA